MIRGLRALNDVHVNLLDIEFHIVVGGTGMKEWTVSSEAVACYANILVAKITKKSRISNLEFHYTCSCFRNLKDYFLEKLLGEVCSLPSPPPPFRFPCLL